MTVRFPFPADKFVLIGRVTRAHGVRGEMRVSSLSGKPEQWSTYSRVALVATDGRMTALLRLTRVSPQKHQVILKLETIDSKSEADLTTGMGVLLPIENAVASDAQERSASRLLGLRVRNVDQGLLIGTVSDFFHNGAQEILVIKDCEREYLVPFIDEFVVSLDDHELVITPPRGLLDVTSGTTRFVDLDP